MKKLLYITLFLAATFIVNKTSAQFWNTTGNTSTAGEFFGTLNNFPINIRTGNTLRATYTSFGSFQWQSCNATFNRSFAIGQNTTASGFRSASFGRSTTASGTNSMAGGAATVAAGNNSLAWGSFATAANGTNSALRSLNAYHLLI